jgi:hypothetical protein
MVRVPPSTDTADASDADDTAADTDTTTEKKPSTKTATPKAGVVVGESAAKEDPSAPTGKPDHPGAKSPKRESDKREATPKNEAKKADTESPSEGATQKQRSDAKRASP